MAVTTKLFWLHVLTSLKVGSEAGAGLVVAPTLLKSSTNYSFIPGTTIKAVLAHHFRAANRREQGSDRSLLATFGAGSQTGALNSTDAYIVSLLDIFSDLE